MRTGSRLLVALVLAAATVLAAEARPVPVNVIYDGDDLVGNRLVHAVKENFRASSGFILTDSGFPRVDIHFSTIPRDTDHPDWGTCYCTVWVFKTGESMTREIYINHTLGWAGSDRVKECSDDIVAFTDQIIEESLPDVDWGR